MAESPVPDHVVVKDPVERAPSPSSEIPPRSPSKTSPRRIRSPSKSEASEEGETRDSPSNGAPPLPDEPLPATDGEAPPLPSEPVPRAVEDDGWEAHQDPASGHYYYYNRFSNEYTWVNPRVPEASPVAAVPSSYYGAPGTEPYLGAPGTTQPSQLEQPREPYLGYNPKIHGDFDPNADYAKYHQPAPAQAEPSVDIDEAANKISEFGQVGTFNRRTGAFQAGSKSAEYHNDDNKSKRQMNAFFDVDRAANAHDGRSLKAERAQQKLSKAHVKTLNENRRAKKEQKRREFLMS